MQTNNVNSLVPFNALHADEIDKPENSINQIIVKKEPRTGSLFPICTLETFVLHAQIRNKELVPDSRFPIISFILIYTHRIHYMQTNNVNSLVLFYAIHAGDIGKAGN